MDDIQIATNPAQVASLIKASPQTSNSSNSGASVDEILAKIEQDKMSKEDQASALATLQEKSKPKQKPLQLKYIYEGTHTCGNSVKTIMITTKGILTASAYCISCDETVSQIEVQPINNPKPEPTKSVEPEETALETKNDIILKKEKK